MNNRMAHVVPRLSTERLFLRGYRRVDFEAFAAHLADPVSAAHLGLSDRESSWRRFCSHAGMWLIDGAGWWSVELRATGQLVGNVGAFFRESATTVEIGWNTYRDFWGHGYASEAAGAALSWAFDMRAEPRARALIASGNASSVRVATRLGFVRDGQMVSHGKPVDVYTLIR